MTLMRFRNGSIERFSRSRKAVTSSACIFDFLLMSATLGGLISFFIVTSFFCVVSILGLLCWRINTITFLFHERTVNESESQSPLCFVNHRRADERTSFRAFQVRHSSLVANSRMQERKLLRFKDSVEEHPEQSAVPIFLIENELLITLATKEIKKMRVAPTGIYILVFFERMLSCFLIHNVFVSFLFRLSKNSFD